MSPSPSVRQIAITISRLFLVAWLLMIWAGLSPVGYSAPAATIWYVAQVGGSDSNPCTTTLQPCEHIQAAINRSASGDTINIAAGTYIEPLTIVDRDLTLKGQSSANTILDGNQLNPVLMIIRNSASSMIINISGVTLTHGKSSQPGGAVSNATGSTMTISDSQISYNVSTNGGGIFNGGLMSLVNVIVRNNTIDAASGGLEGGGIYNVGTLRLSNVTLANNQAPLGGGISNLNTLTVTTSFIGPNFSTGTGSVYGGGGIYNRGIASYLYVADSTLSGNQALHSGGGIYNDHILISSNTVISGNKTTAANGGGIYNSADGQMSFNSGTLNNNTAPAGVGGGLYSTGVMTLTGTVLTANSAAGSGGIHNASAGRLMLGASSIFSNTAAGSPGGGIGNDGVLTLTQSAVIYNAAATSQGGGLNNTGSAQLTNVTISNNTAAAASGIQNNGGALSLQFDTISNTLVNASGTVTVGNSILTQSSGTACSGAIVSAGYNIDSGNSCNLSGPSDKTATNPLLGPLQDNGGSSLTRAVAFSSPAVDSANDTVCPDVDQRGVNRIKPCDRGAYEVVGYTKHDALDFGPHQCVTSTLDVPDKFYIGRLLAGVYLTYTNRSELRIRLLSPGTPKVLLLDHTTNNGANLNTLFDDSAPIMPVGDQYVVTSFFENPSKPTTPLLQVRGVNIKGTWRLEICNTGSSIGTLNRWALVVPEFSNTAKVYLPIVRR